LEIVFRKYQYKGKKKPPVAAPAYAPEVLEISYGKTIT
jgi:hypothetical protein